MHTILASHRSEIDAACRRHGVHRLEAFGSATTASFDPLESDVDLLVEFDDPMSATYLERYFGLKDDLEHLFGRSVDLVVTSSIRNPHFLRRVELTKELLFAS